LALVIAALAISCGKKGPPLPPYIRQPAAAEVTSAVRVGDDVFVTVSVPTANIDGSMPASVQEIEVWGATAAAPPSPFQFLDVATRVATIPVARYADPGDRSGTVVPDPKTGALQGASVTVRDSLTADEMKPSSAKATDGKPISAKATEAEPTSDTAAAGTRVGANATVAAPAPPPDPQTLRRYYMTIPVSERKRPGPPSKILDVPLTSVPDRIAVVSARMDGRHVVIEWEPSGGMFGFLLGRALPVEQPPVGERPAAAARTAAAAGPAAGPLLYNVYRELSPDPLALPVSAVAESPWASNPESPVNAQPQAMLSFSEELPFDERRRCYHVRAVRGTGAQRVESAPSPRACIVPVDTEPPAAVTNLFATAVEGSITLRWDPNGEEDLRGYIVLRSEGSDDTLQQITKGPPLARTTFTDENVTSGQTYRYVVQAVDNRIPVPNVSDPTDTTATGR
jgi:hypothetical protein